MSDQRSQQLAQNLHQVQDRISAACAAAGRSADEITLIVVTKFFGADDVRRLAALGATDVGENRDQEASEKHAGCADLDLTWHFIGQLQTNKAKSVVRYADLVHTVDRVSLAKALDKAAGSAGTRQDVLIQVSLDPVAGSRRGGVGREDFEDLVQAVVGLENLRLRGVMGVAPLDEDPTEPFARLARASLAVREHEADADIISAGMSTDLEAAVAAGATHLRIGAAVMGSRPTVRYRPSNGGKHNEGETQ